jgi:bifunctional DNA-binding transcriptional regulator/antitoxin component of YhaV-PrlF toxin-antitoxin module
VINKGSGQVTIPARILRAVDLEHEDTVYVGVNPEDPRTIILVPGTLFDAWVHKGRRVDDGSDPASD